MRSLDRPMEIVIYMRSSRAEHPWAFKSQETTIRELLDRLGIQHDRACVITDATNGVMAHRPGYMRIVAMCEQGTAILLAVQDLTRLGRLDTILCLIKRIVELGGRFLSVEEPVDTARTGWEGLFEAAGVYAYRRGRGEVDDE